VQRLSIFLGHPAYGLAIGLFGIILSTGLGSFLSERFPRVSPGQILGWSSALALYVALLPFWLPYLVSAGEAMSLPIRAAIALVAIVPSGLLMGFGFPTGMRLVNAIDERPTPWFWAVNGAAGVLAASLAIAVGIELAGASAVVIGRSILVGKPIALLLLERNATVTICHSRTRDLAAVVGEADVLIAAAGSPLLVKGDWIRPGAAVVDLGVNMVDGVQVGDVDFGAALGVAGLLTPSRGGVGPLTITMLLRNTLEAYEARTGIADA